MCDVKGGGDRSSDAGGPRGNGGGLIVIMVKTIV
jgi:hypothetical protein